MNTQQQQNKQARPIPYQPDPVVSIVQETFNSFLMRIMEPFALVAHMIIRPGVYGARSLMTALNFFISLIAQQGILLAEGFSYEGGDELKVFSSILLFVITLFNGVVYVGLNIYRERTGRTVHSRLEGQPIRFLKPLLKLPFVMESDLRIIAEPAIILLLASIVSRFSIYTSSFLLFCGICMGLRNHLIYNIQRNRDLDESDQKYLVDQLQNQSQESTYRARHIGRAS